MNIPDSAKGLAAHSSQMAQNTVEAAVGVTVFKKAIDLQQQSIGQLLQSVAPSVQALPDGVGTRINVTA